MRLFEVAGQSVDRSQTEQCPGRSARVLYRLFQHRHSLLKLILVGIDSAQEYGHVRIAWAHIQSPAAPLRRFVKSPRIIVHSGLQSGPYGGEGILTRDALRLSESFFQKPLRYQIPKYEGSAIVRRTGGEFHRM